MRSRPDGRRVGGIVDVRLEISGAPAQLLSATVVTGLLVEPPNSRSRRGATSAAAENGPVVIARLQRWLHRGMFLVAWDDVELVDEGRVVFREGYERALDPMLPQAPRSSP